MENLTAYVQAVSFFFFSSNGTKVELKRERDLLFPLIHNKKTIQSSFTQNLVHWQRHFFPRWRRFTTSTTSRDKKEVSFSGLLLLKQKKERQIDILLFLDLLLNQLLYWCRCYPGPWQVLRRTRNKCICVHQQETMPSLKEVALNILASAWVTFLYLNFFM